MRRFRIWPARLILPREIEPKLGAGGNATVGGSGIAIGGRGSPNGTATVSGKGPRTWTERDNDGNLLLMQEGGGMVIGKAVRNGAAKIRDLPE